MIKSFLPSATVFTSNGERIIQAVKCIEHRELGDWYIDIIAPLEYQAYLEKDYILVVPTKEKGDQPFRINNPKITDKVDVRAYHIGFDTKNYAVELSTVVNGNAQTCLNTLSSNINGTHPFTFTSAITTLKSFSVVDSSLYNTLIQIAEEYNGILDFNGWNITISSSIGADNGVVLAYGKNIQESEVNENWDLVVTKLKPIGNNGITLTPAWLTADISYDRPYTKIMNFDTDDVSNLGLVAQLYLDRYKVPRVNYKVKADVEQNVALGDAVVVNARQFTTTAEVLSFDYNPLINRVIQVEFGNFRPTLKQFFSDMVQDTEEKAVKRAQVKIDAANGKINLVVGDVANLDGIVNGNQANGAGLTLTPSAITTVVRSSTEYTNDLGAKADASALASYSTITQTADKVALEIGQIKVGGTNLLYGSDMEELSSRNLWLKSIGTETTTDGSVDTVFQGKNLIVIVPTDTLNGGIYRAVGGLVIGQQYTLSAWVYVPSGQWQMGTDLGYPTFTVPFLTWTRVSHTFTATSAVHTLYFIAIQRSAQTVIYIDNVQLEEGNKPTAWGLNPNEMRTAKYVFDGESGKFYDADFELWRSGVRKLYFDTVSGKYKFDGEIIATSGKIGRFDISGDDLVYTSDLFNKEYDYGDLSKIGRIMAELDTPTAYESEVYDVNRDGLLDILDLVLVSNYVKSGTALPTPRRQIRSVIRIGTTSGELRTTSVSALGNTGSTFVMKAENLSGELLNVKGISAKGGTIELLDVINGVRFPATFVGSNDVYTLDDYREGTWTPTVIGGTSAGVGTYTNQVGEYTKIGNVVHCTINIAWTAHTGTGIPYITLPFEARTGIIAMGSIMADNLTFTGQLAFGVIGGTSVGQIWRFPSAGLISNIAFDTSATVYATLTYTV